MTIDEGLLIDWICRFVLNLCRVSGFVMAFPHTGSWSPRAFRTVLAVAMTVFSMQFTSDTTLLRIDLLIFFRALSEFSFGVLLGLVVSVFIAVYTTAGQLIGMQMALGFAEINDPTSGARSSVTAELYQLIALILFLLVDGHLLVLSYLFESFRTISLHTLLSHELRGRHLLSMVSWMLESGFMLATPIVSCLFAVNLAFGFMTRSAPQLNILTLGFPMLILAGLILNALCVGHVSYFFTDSVTVVADILGRIAYE